MTTAKLNPGTRKKEISVVDIRGVLPKNEGVLSEMGSEEYQLGLLLMLRFPLPSFALGAGKQVGGF